MYCQSVSVYVSIIVADVSISIIKILIGLDYMVRVNVC